MKCGIIYFSATGNTEYVAKLFKTELEKNSISCDLLECSRSKPDFEKYDMFVLGGPIHCEVFPDYYEDYVLKNLPIGKGRKVIIFGTQVAEHSLGPHKLGNKLEKVGFKVVIEAIIRMPNNYFLVGFRKTDEEKRSKFIEEASEKVEYLVESFLNNKRCFDKVGTINKVIAKSSYKLFKKYSYGWAKRKLSIDMSLCIKCGKCEKECPTQNINLENEKVFKENCISCQRCIHSCPVNAFTYKGKHFEQYKKVF